MLALELKDYIRKYIEENYTFSTHSEGIIEEFPVLYCGKALALNTVAAETLDDILANVDESFSRMLFKIIDAKNLTDPEVYRKAQLDRRLFSKIRKDVFYQPSRNTAIALAFGLKLNLEQTQEFIGRAGYVLTHSSKFDLIVEYFIKEEIFDVNLLNDVLFDYELPLLKP